jgi:hypothetical protein
LPNKEQLVSIFNLYSLTGNDNNDFTGATLAPNCKEIIVMRANPAPFTHPNLRMLRVDASARGDGSVSRQLADQMLLALDARVPGLSIVRRDVAAGLPYVDAAWVGANLTEPDARDAGQRQALAKSLMGRDKRRANIHASGSSAARLINSTRATRIFQWLKKRGFEMA